MRLRDQAASDETALVQAVRATELTCRAQAGTIRAMARASQPPPVKLLCGMLSSRADWLEEAKRELEKRFGPADIASEIMDFAFTHYYDEQMGSPLLRQFVAFERLVSPDALADAKHITNGIEDDFAARAGAGEAPLRPVNLDAGYVDSPKLVLASMKNFAHRVYLGRGVYAEVTLLRRRGGWTTLEWTFPDYGSGLYWPYLERVRSRLREQLAA
jgi:hypothetical protein